VHSKTSLHARQYAKHGGKEEKQMTTAGGVNKQMGKEKPDLHDENTKSTLKQ
jgi:hypothetical protein